MVVVASAMAPVGHVHRNVPLVSMRSIAHVSRALKLAALVRTQVLLALPRVIPFARLVLATIKLITAALAVLAQILELPRCV